MRASKFLSAGLVSLVLAGSALAQGIDGNGGRGIGGNPRAGVPSSGGAFTGSVRFTASGLPANTFWANTYGSCVWGLTAGNDAAPCINAAIAAAVAAGGGTVVVPAGSFNIAATITQNTPGVHIEGAGLGIPRDNSFDKYYAATRLVWTGAAGGTMLDVEPASVNAMSLYSADVKGIAWDGANLAGICARIAQTTFSTFVVGSADCRVTNTHVTTTNSVDSPGTQHNDFWLYSRSTSGTYAPTGILIDGGQGSTWNVSYNHFHDMYAWFNLGDGIVFGSQDNNLVDTIRTFPNPGSVGMPAIVAVPGYVMPNGQAVTSGATFVGGSLRFLHTGTALTVQGFTLGSTLVAGVHAGSAAVTPVTLTTDTLTGIFSSSMHFPSTTGVGAGMDFSCGGYSSGVLNNSTVYLTTGTTVSPTFWNVRAVPSGTACTFGYGVTRLAVAGVYTITATGATTYNITAPAGGHTQSGISVSGGVLTFTDVVIPMTGSASVGDTFILTTPKPQQQIIVEGVDNGNANPEAYFASGSGGSSSTLTNPLPFLSGVPTLVMTFGRATCNDLQPTGGGVQSITIGDCGGVGASGTNSTVIGGITNNASGFGATTIGGQNLSATGIDSVVSGSDNTTSGLYSSIPGGFHAGDRGRYGTYCRASGQFATQGDAQTCGMTLRGTGASTTAIRMTADGAAAGAANCINMPNNSAYAVTITVMALDHTTVSKNETWPMWTGLLTRGANAAATVLTMNTTPTPLSSGTVTGSSISATADTSNGCVNLSFTPPTGNTDTWNSTALVETVEVQ